jgi:hypothetical protein
MTIIPDNILSLAKKCKNETGIPVSVILAQWILETGAFKSNLFRYCYNLAGIKYHQAYTNSNGFTCYPSLEAAADDWIRTIRLGYYDNVRRTASQTNVVEDIIKALGESPWDAGHYNNGQGAGSSLQALYKADNLQVFDALPNISGVVATTELVVGQPIEYFSSDDTYYIKPEYAGKSLVKINELNNHILGRADILAGFLGVNLNSPLEFGQILPTNKIPKSYVPNSSEWKGFLAITQTTKPENYVLPDTKPTEETPSAVEEKKVKRAIPALYMILLLALDSILTKIRLAVKYQTPEAK